MKTDVFFEDLNSKDNDLIIKNIDDSAKVDFEKIFTISKKICYTIISDWY